MDGNIHLEVQTPADQVEAFVNQMAPTLKDWTSLTDRRDHSQECLNDLKVKTLREFAGERRAIAQSLGDCHASEERMFAIRANLFAASAADNRASLIEKGE